MIDKLFYICMQNLGLPIATEYINSKISSATCKKNALFSVAMVIYEHFLKLNEGDSILSTLQLRSCEFML